MTRRVRSRTAGLVSALVVLSACSTDTTRSGAAGTDAGEVAQPVGDVITVPTTTPDAIAADDGVAPGSTAAPTTVAPTTTVPEPQFFNEECVVVIEPGDTLTGLIERFDDGETINRVSLRAENELSDETLRSGDVLDVCPGNGLDDATGSERLDPSEDLVAAAVQTNVEMQQRKLNQLFADLGTQELLVDGVSGPVTRQRLCAARLALGLEVSTADMAAGSEEERALLDAEELPAPPEATVDQDRWVLIDQTCQFMFAGEVDGLVFGFPTSTGEAGHETRLQDRSRAFRFDPAVDNGGWHDSTDFPVSIDNPLNGNMYKPLYFDGGQAIHGANNVPTSPQSKGCARLSVAHQDLLVDWLGLAADTAPTWSRRAIGLTVSVQGHYVEPSS
ncbi:MAG: L,D-transpeptidase [Actinomycetota bacterium]